MSYNELYGLKPRKKKGPHWDRIIIAGLLALAILYLFIRGIGKLFSSSKDSDSSTPANASSVAASANSNVDNSVADSKPEVLTQYDLTVCVDPGHGGEDGGTVSADGNRLEKNDDLNISLKLRDYLKKYGVTVVMTREDDTFVELQDRTDLANNQKCDLFICMHRNAFDEGMRGAGVWVHSSQPKEDITLGTNIMNELAKVGISENLGVGYGFGGDTTQNYHINACTLMPSCLVELGFVTDEIDNKDFDAHIDEYAKAVADAIVKSAVDLGITDKDGKRLISGPFFTENKSKAVNGNIAPPSTDIEQ